MKKNYSIGYKDSCGDFTKLWDDKGYTLKFTTIEEAKKYILEQTNFLQKNCNIKTFKIMQGWNIIEEMEV